MSFAPASSMTTARESHTTTLLRNGKVPLAGGNDGNTALASAELFDPQTGSFTPIASMNRPRSFHTATLLKDGKVLVVGGQDAKSAIFATAEIFDLATGRFALTGQMSTAREFHTATLLEDGRVLIAGGDNGNEALATAELFDPETGKFSSTGSMQQSRESHTATLRDDGTVLVVGGNALISELDGGVHADRRPVEPIFKDSVGRVPGEIARRCRYAGGGRAYALLGIGSVETAIPANSFHCPDCFCHVSADTNLAFETS